MRVSSFIGTALLFLLSPQSSDSFAPKPFVSSSPWKTTARPKTATSMVVDPSSFFADFSSSLLSYSDDPLGDQLKGVNGVVVAAILATVVAIGFGFTALLPSVGTARFSLTPEEEEAISRVNNGYDSKQWEREITEEGTKGYVNRRRLAQEAKDAYQDGKIMRDVKDRSLRYSEADLGFIACLIRAAEPQKGDILVDMGSGTGRSTLGAAAIFPDWGKCIGVEFLGPLVKLCNSYKGKVRGRKAPVEFVNADFAEYDLSEADMVFATATYFNNGDLEKGLQTLRSGAKVLIIDKKLGGGFKLISEVEDPSGDLVLNTGYVYEKA